MVHTKGFATETFNTCDFVLLLSHTLACISVWQYRTELQTVQRHRLQGRARCKKLAAPTAHSPAPSKNRRIRNNARFCASKGQYRTDKNGRVRSPNDRS